MALDHAVVGWSDFALGRDGPNRVIFLTPISWEQRAATIAQDGVVNRTRIQRSRPIELPDHRAVFTSRRIENQLFVSPLERYGEEKIRIDLRTVARPPIGKRDLDARFESSVIRNDRFPACIGKPELEIATVGTSE